jgi:hypothetical protein
MGKWQVREELGREREREIERERERGGVGWGGRGYCAEHHKVKVEYDSRDSAAVRGDRTGADGPPPHPISLACMVVTMPKRVTTALEKEPKESWIDIRTNSNDNT